MERPSVLLADDHRLVAEALAAILAPEFELIGIADDGQALVDAAAEHQPAVIVSDISMPGLNGIEALEVLATVAPDTRVVMLTMHRSAAYVQQAFAAGVAAYVLKHAATTELLNAVRAAARGETWTPPEIQELLASRTTESPFKRLSPRQQQILRLLADGLSAKAIAARLNISPRTVEFHKYSMMETLGISSTAELVRHAFKAGIVEI